MSGLAAPRRPESFIDRKQVMRMRSLIGMVLLASTAIAGPAASQNAENRERKVLFLYSLLQHVRQCLPCFA